MESIGFYNLLSLIIGLSVIVVTCLIFFVFQKYFFSKYRNKVKTALEIATNQQENNQ